MGVSGPLRNRGTGKQALFLRHFLPKMTKSHADFEWNFTAIPLDPLLGYLVDIPWNSLDVLHGFLRLFFVFSSSFLVWRSLWPWIFLLFPFLFPRISLPIPPSRPRFHYVQGPPLSDHAHWHKGKKKDRRDRFSAARLDRFDQLVRLVNSTQIERFTIASIFHRWGSWGVFVGVLGGFCRRGGCAFCAVTCAVKHKSPEQELNLSGS